jgi:hypothetical protein
MRIQRRLYVSIAAAMPHRYVRTGLPSWVRALGARLRSLHHHHTARSAWPGVQICATL